jgi:hypothetical protein
VNNSGAALWSAGNFSTGSAGTFTNQATGTFTTNFDGSFAYNPGGGTSVFNNAGTFTKSGGTGTTTFSSTFNNTGTVAAASGTLAFTSTFTNTGGSLIAAGGNFSFTNALNVGSGNISGYGTFTAPGVTTGGITSPGAALGLLNFSGALTLQATSNLLMELGGVTEGVTYDSLHVGGVLNLGGDLQVSLINAFNPATGATFNLFDAASVTGTFATVTLPTITPGLSWDTSALYTTGIVSVTGTAVPEPTLYTSIFGLSAIGLALRRRATRVRRIIPGL